MSEHTERYALDIDSTMVILIDTKTGIREGFMGDERLAHAMKRVNFLEARDLLAEEVTEADLDQDREELIADAAEYQVSPTEFLADVLPAFARRQRLEGMLEQVQAIEDSLVTLLAEDSRNLNRATSLKLRLQEALNGQPSEPESVEKRTLVGTGTPADLETLRALSERMPHTYGPMPY